MSSRFSRGAVRLALVVVAGAAASLALAAPASADGPPVTAINDGEARCTPTGDIVLPWHFNGIPSNITDITSVPNGVLFIAGDPPYDADQIVVWQLVPNGTPTAGLTFTWTDQADPQHTGTGTGTTVQEFPANCTAEVSADFVSKCDRLVDVTVHNDSEDPGRFTANGTDRMVEADASAVFENVVAQDNGAVDVTFDWIPRGYPFLDGLPLATYTWKDPGGCPTATPSPSPTPNASLPLTGSSVGGVIGVGGGLLAAGAALVVISLLRRRRASATR